jgi:hypothetical protein
MSFRMERLLLSENGDLARTIAEEDAITINKDHADGVSNKKHSLFYSPETG